MDEVITVKKNKFAEFFKGKGYYVLLFVGVLAIAAVAIIGARLSSEMEKQEQNYVDLNDTDENIADQDNDNLLAEDNLISDGIVNNEDNPADDFAANDNAGQNAVDAEDQVEYEGYGKDTDVAAVDDTSKDLTAETTKPKDDAVETTGSNLSSALDKLSFDRDEGLAWPVNGNVIMNYSMDHTIYFATLMQYKCNPAIIIDAEIGTEVKAAADGVITGIDATNEETGMTVTMEIGDGYSVVYGQLDNLNHDVGDFVTMGDTIGTVAEPTKYYTVEGSNLYFQVMENGKTINPMLLLR